jgi:hypothetical protein
VKLSLRMSCIFAVALLSQVAITVSGASGPSKVEQGHLSGLMAKITLPGGATRTVRLEGVGCAASICSRTTIKGRTGHDALQSTWLDSIAAIKGTTEADALLVMKDGTERRLSLVTDFRVLYVRNGSGAAEKLDLAAVKSVEFTSPPTVEGGK